MTAWTAQIHRDPDAGRWAAQVWRLTEHPPPERIEKTCSHPHSEQDEALRCARAWRDQPRGGGGMNVLSLCAGIGGLDLGFERAGLITVGQVELDEFCRRVLAKHWPEEEVPKHDDVRTCVEWWRSRPRPPVHLVAAGFPCQPVSNAGERRGDQDERWLWPAVDSVLGELRPEWFVFENVPGLRTMGLGTVLADLHRRGYRVRVGEISACAVGAPHTRTRLFGLAHAPGVRLERGRCAGTGSSLLEREGRGPQPRRFWAAEPRPHGVAYGLPDRVDRLKGAGNAVVPQVAEVIGRLIVAADRAEEAA